jgi:hypothetical protein
MQLDYNQTNHEIIPILKNIKYLWINIQNNISIDIGKIITIQRLFPIFYNELTEIDKLNEIDIYEYLLYEFII